MGNSKQANSCLSGRPTQTPTIRQAAARLMDALDRVAAEQPCGFMDWEGEDGAPLGAELEEARHELRTLLARAPAAPPPMTGVTLDADAFEQVWKSDRVQEAGRAYGWRGIAEVVWAAAMEARPDPVGP